MGNLSAHLV